MDLKQFQPAVSPEQAKACQTAFGKAAPADCTDATKALGKAIYTAIRNKWLEEATPPPDLPSGEKSLFDGIAATGQRNRQPAPVLLTDDTLTAHLKHLGGR